MRYRLVRTWLGSVLGLMLVLSGCGGGNVATTITQAETMIVGVWENQSIPQHVMWFMEDERVHQTTSSDHIVSGSYELSEREGQLVIDLQSPGNIGMSGSLQLSRNELCLPLSGCFTRIAEDQAPTLPDELRDAPRAGSGMPSPPASPTSAEAGTATALPSTSTPTVVPAATALPPTSTPTVVPSATAPADSDPTNDSLALTFRTVPTSDGFVAVRERPTTGSSEITRLSPGTEVGCTGFVAGESLLFDGRRTDQWAECPSVGGYIFGLLLVAGDAAATAPDSGSDTTAPGSDITAIVAAVRAHVGVLSFNYSVENICMDREFATATVVPEAGATDPARALLQRIDGNWTVIFFGPGMGLMGAENRRQLGVPEDFACLGEPVTP